MRAVLLGTAAAASLCLGGPAAGADATWLGTTSGDWTTGANWSTGAAPSGSDVATFGTAPNTTIDTPTTSIGTIQFGQSADSYYFGVGNTFAVTGGGILNGSSNVQIFYIDGALNFTGGTITGAVDIYNDSALSYANASAGSANIFNFTSATVDFNADSSAGNATISNGSFATINFNGGSTAGTTRIDNLSGFVNFNATSSAENITIVNDGIGSTVTFSGTSTAGQATITNTGGFVIFVGSASAGNANIANDPTSAPFRTIEFNVTSTAGNATLTTANGARINFFENSTGGTATLIANSGGAVRFFDSALGDRARLVANAGGSIEIIALGTTATTAGSIEGAGTLRLGAKTLTVGFNDLSTTFSGRVQGNGGSLVKGRNRNADPVGSFQHLYRHGGVALEPFAGLAFVRVSTRGVTETGGAAALAGAGNSEGVGYSSLGLRAATHHTLQNGLVLTPRASLAWQHAFDEVTPDAALAFASNGASFTTAGVPIARDSALVDAGFDVDVNANARLGIGYLGQLARDAQDHGVKGNLRVPF